MNRYEALELKVHFFVTKDIRGLGDPEWQVGHQGNLEALIMLNGEPYDPANVPEHGKWAARTGAGYNWSVSTLPLLPPINQPTAVPVATPAIAT